MIGSLLGFMLSTAVAPTNVFAYTPAAQAATVTPAAPVKISKSYGVRTNAQGVFVADESSGKVLYQKNPHAVLPIASITKLVTAMVFLDMHPDMSKTVTMQDGDFDNEGEDPVFKSGDVLSYDDLIRSLLVGSVNASANAIARTTVGTPAFVAAMNKKVRDLHLSTPHFVEPSGINPEDHADAADVAAILSAASGYPLIRQIDSLPEVDVTSRSTKETYHVQTTNLLLASYLNKAPYHIVAAKTGTLPQAGYCMAQVTSHDGHEIVVVELGDDNHFGRYQDVKALTTWAFGAYEWK